MGNELGDETDIDLLLVPPVTSPPDFALIGNDDFSAEFGWNLVQNVGVFEFSPISRRLTSRIMNMVIFFTSLFSCTCTGMSGGSVPTNFKP